jgi:hypothetical protein
MNPKDSMDMLLGKPQKVFGNTNTQNCGFLQGKAGFALFPNTLSCKRTDKKNAAYDTMRLCLAKSSTKKIKSLATDEITYQIAHLI